MTDRIAKDRSMKAISVIIIAALLISMPAMTAPIASATCCNILPPWGVGIGLCDFIGCFDVISILNVFNCCNLINILGIVANCFSGINYSVECGWNFLSYCIWPCTLFNCFNLVDLFSGRITCFNFLQIMSGIINFGNIIDILSGACINLMSVVKIGSALFPPCIASGGCINIGTGCNPCNPIIPVCINTGLTDCLNVLFLPLTVLMTAISSIAMPFITAWSVALAPALTGMGYPDMMASVVSCIQDPIPAITGLVKTFLYSAGIMDLLGGIGSVCSGCLGWIGAKLIGCCQSVGILDWLFNTMSGFLPMRIGFV